LSLAVLYRSVMPRWIGSSREENWHGKGGMLLDEADVGWMTDLPCMEWTMICRMEAHFPIAVSS
jgi:hypothetical protein